MENLKVNQIVKGEICGTFVILGFRTDLDPNEVYAQLKPVNPSDYSQVGSGELALPVSKLKPAA